MGCGSSTGSDEKLAVKHTTLSGMDGWLDDVQGIIDEIYELKDPIDDSRDELLENTEFDTVACGNSHHAIVGIIFALASQSNGTDVASLFKLVTHEPFIEINSKSASGKLFNACKSLAEYLKALTTAKDRIQPLSDKVKTISEKVPELPTMMKDELEKAKDASFGQKITAAKSTTHNTKVLGKLPNLVNELKLTIQSAFEELKEATKELDKSKDKLGDIGKKCNSGGKKSAKECYLHCGQAIQDSPDAKKKWEASKKGKKGKGKGKAPSSKGAKK